MSRRSHWSLLLLTLAGCAVGPDFKAPETATGSRFTAQELPASTAATAIPGGEAQTFVSGKPLPAQWWTLFGSDKLNQLVQQALANSPSVASAQAALRRAQEDYRAQRSVLWPSLDANASATRQKVNTASFANTEGGVVIYNLYNASIDVSYGIDLFGGTRRANEAALAQLDYQQFQLESTYQTLIANVVTTAVQEARPRALMTGRKMTISDLEGLLGITEKQFEFGAVGQAAVLLARSNLAADQANLPVLEKQLSVVQHQLAVYLGKLPSEMASTDFDLTELKIPQELPLSLPSELVRQRPDIRAAEAQLHQASAGVGLAIANQLPQIRISGSYGSQAAEAGDLFKDGIWSIGAGLTQPIFHAGQLNAKRRAAVAAYDQSAADYRQTVLLAFKNVADGLRALEADARVLQAQTTAAESADAAFAMIQKQYELGVVSYADVLDAQRQRTLAKAGLVQALADRHQDTAALLLALGGGWWNRSSPEEPAATPVADKQP